MRFKQIITLYLILDLIFEFCTVVHSILSCSMYVTFIMSLLYISTCCSKTLFVWKIFNNFLGYFISVAIKQILYNGLFMWDFCFVQLQTFRNIM